MRFSKNSRKKRKFGFPPNWLRRPESHTNFQLPPTIIGFPFSRWGARPFIVHPIPFPVNCLADLNSRHQATPIHVRPSRNPVHVALEWRALLDSDNTLSMAKIAANTGISRARVTQIMNLLDLPDEIITYVSSLTARDDLRLFSERNLRRIRAIAGTMERLAAFRLLRRQHAC